MGDSIPLELMRSGDLDDVALNESCVTSNSDSGKISAPSSTTSYEYHKESSEYL